MRIMMLLTSLFLMACPAPEPTSRRTTTPDADRPAPARTRPAKTSPPRRERPSEPKATPRRSPAAFKWTAKFQTPDGLPDAPRSFSSAKKKALRTVYKGHQVTFYCGCGYTAQKKVDASRCGYRPRKANVRSRRIEWEHVVPASAFGQHRACWKRGACPRARGRRCCRKIDPEFKRMEADLQNLVPAVGELNADRSNFRFGDIPGEARVYGTCDFEVDRSKRIAEPATVLRGEIAGTYLYMYFAYRKDGTSGLPLTKAQVARFVKWHQADPPDNWERMRNLLIGRIQGGRNPLVN